MSPRTLLILCLACLPMAANPAITSSVSCSSPVGVFPNGISSVTSTATTNCSLDTQIEVPPGYALIQTNQYARAFTSSTYTQNQSGFDLMISANANASAEAAANASLTFSDTFEAGGPVRNGFLYGSFMSGVGRYAGLLSLGLNVAGQNYNEFGPGAPLRPIVLGQPFTVTAYVSARQLSDDGTPSFVNLTSYIKLNFVEGDGVTPVTLSEVPEPSSAFLCGFGVAGMAWFSLAKRRSRSFPRD